MEMSGRYLATRYRRILRRCRHWSNADEQS